MAYEVLNARVKQKIATEAEWIAEEDTFGVIFEGEPAFVKNDDGTPVNFKIGDGTKKFSELAYFIAYYSNVTNQKVLPYLNQSANITISSTFRVNSYLTDVIFLNSFGSTINLKIGTTDGGNEIGEISLDTGISVLGFKVPFQSATTLYFTGLNSTSFSMFVLYIQMDEAPVVPPSGGGTTQKDFYPNGHFGFFSPSYAGHENDAFDFSTGLGKPGTGYGNCAICNGENGTPDATDVYAVGYKTGDTLNTIIGNNNDIILTSANIPPIKVVLPANQNGVPGSGGITFGGSHNNDLSLGVVKMDGTPLSDSPTGISKRLKSLKLLPFKAISNPS